MDINFELYKVFYYVGKSLSFSMAAQQLYISQSAVSQSIKNLEQKLDIPLFFRHTKQVKLTQEGELLLQHIEPAFHLIKTGERNLQETLSLQRGEIRVGASDTICRYYLLPYFQQFSEFYPHMKIQITNRTSPEGIHLLKQGQVDVSVIHLPNPHLTSQITVLPFREIQDVFIVGKAFFSLINEKRLLSLKELEDKPFLMLEKPTATRHFFDTFLAEQEIYIEPEIELGSLDLLVQLCKIGLGISIVPEECIQDISKEDIQILPVQEMIPKRELGIAYLNSIPLSRGTQEWIRLLISSSNK
ncbi:MAG: LysR family transcriptional regulator [Epulopiscium sp.]|nr:LysR family transcriptional regulator [Candidatus Epulonipiscium sp.]